MIFQDVAKKAWRDTFVKKMASFAKKAPILVSFEVIQKDDNLGVAITHVNSNTVYYFRFDYNADIKDFIAAIKALLVSKHYPRLVEELWKTKDLSAAEIADRIQKGANITDISPTEVVLESTNIYRIDKVISYRNIAILVLEDSNDKEQINKVLRYQMSTSLMIFLKKYREGRFTDIKDASNYFWQNSILIDVLAEKGDE